MAICYRQLKYNVTVQALSPAVVVQQVLADGCIFQLLYLVMPGAEVVYLRECSWKTRKLNGCTYVAT